MSKKTKSENEQKSVVADLLSDGQSEALTGKEIETIIADNWDPADSSYPLNLLTDSHRNVEKRKSK